MKNILINIKSSGALLVLATLLSFCNRPDKTTATTATATPEPTTTVHEHERAPVPAQSVAQIQPTGALPHDKVCMVNNAYMGGKPQVPVPHENKTYYGCCNMCVDKIKNDRTVRFGIDPVTGKEVDKATAFITLKPGSTDEVLYFESEANYNKFRQ